MVILKTVTSWAAGDGDATAQPPAPAQWQARGQAPDGRLQPERWGTSVAAGQPLRLCVCLTNQVAVSSSRKFNGIAHTAPHPSCIERRCCRRVAATAAVCAPRQPGDRAASLPILLHRHSPHHRLLCSCPDLSQLSFDYVCSGISCDAPGCACMQGDAAATVTASLACTNGTGGGSEAEPGTARAAADASSSILCAGSLTGGRSQVPLILNIRLVLDETVHMPRHGE